MNKKMVLLGILVLSLLIPGLYIINMEGLFYSGISQEEMANSLSGFQLRIWFSWIIMVIVAIYYKWISGDNSFFKMIYVLMFIIFIVAGIYQQRMINMFEITTTFQDSYSFGVFSAIINFLMLAILTGFLQLSVWWFTTKWHRK
ncbi:hypothetical protein BH23BAC2_BH23BAC2_07820 [soil metagenome]